MKRFFLLLAMVPLLLTACSSKPLKDVYTATGDETRPEDLDKNTVFNSNDDLNVVITFNAHNRKLPVQAVFIAPDGTSYPTDELEMDKTAGVAVLGLDWEAQGITPWAEGDWKVEIYVDGKREKTLSFTVKTQDAANAG